MPDPTVQAPSIDAADAAPRRWLPLLGQPGGRSALTCTYRCGNACDHPDPNTSGNPHLRDVIAASLSRRDLLRAGAATGVVLGFGGLAAGPAAAATAAPAATEGAEETAAVAAGGSALTFSPVPPNTLDTVVVPNGYDWDIVVRWGDPILPDAPAFDPGDLRPDAQAKQFGYNCDYVAVLPLSGDRALLVVNHEYTDEYLMFPEYTRTARQIRVAQMAHGMSVVEIERAGRTGRWQLVRRGRRRYNRRVTAYTPMRFTGPAAGSPLLRTSADPSGRRVLGTLNNCAGGTTPWGTVLSGEENYDQYFVNGDRIADAELRELYARDGITTDEPTADDNRRWDLVDRRFDLAQEPNEARRFGWIVEVDPTDPDSVPRKHTALGRFKHEGATTAIGSDGRVVAYMGDDQRGEYVYKFISARRFRPGSGAAARRHNMTLLTEGTLFVAKFTGDSPGEIDGSGELPADGAFDGSGEWVRLVSGTRSFVPGMTAEEVLVHPRKAADAVGATRMDRPEDFERNPVTGAVYLSLTNNSRRGSTFPVDEANPLARSTTADGVEDGNRNGHVIELVERRRDASAWRFGWRIFLIAGNPTAQETYFAGYDKSQVSPISCPDNVAFDPAGNLWIATDGNVLGSNDGLFATAVRGGERGHVKQFLSMPVGAETCGPCVTRDARSVFVAVQHPGETDDATFTNPSSTFPDGPRDGGPGIPRPTVVVAYRRDGGRIGS